ncbi:MAG TPA: winged helix-turn-helix domain-containing protein [Ktedonobacteraceae bacterium]
MSLPKFYELFNPVLEAIKRLGGSASIAELDEEVTKKLHLTDKEIAEAHNERMTELEYRLAWARSYLKAYELLNNSERGIWVLTAKGKEIDTVEPSQVTRFVRSLRKSKSSKVTVKDDPETSTDIGIAEVVLEET